MTPSTDTLSGTYGVATIKLPDGTEVPVMARKVAHGDGSYGWAVIDDAQIAFEQRFADTATAPADLLTPKTAVLTKNPTTLTAQDTTARLVSADLVMFLGDPDRIIAQKGLDPERLAHLKAHPASVTMARRLCSLAGTKWQQVLQYIPKFFPESHP